MYKKSPRDIRPLLANILFCTPIFLICFILPAHPQTALDIAIDNLLDDQLFGLTGFWSSLFPFNSKAAANYVAIFGPLLAVFSIYTTLTTETDPKQLESVTLKRYLAISIGGTLFFIFLACTFYLESDDLGTRTGKYGNLFGANVLFFSIHHSLMSFLLFFIAPLFTYSFYYSIPRLFIKRWLCKRQKMKM
ncbi:hypothetical protein N8H74_21335 [Pseudomonas sp. B2M1-30]|uniref:hypothetical protein n=1 Tax=Pseudomonas TaxID=286 RepID=UPI0021C8AE94|nr:MULTISPECIES: hypothetical protein [Pseudomonas]MCU0120812.1 hypothetical protein [Pseudomonas sp. B2M1-30]MCU7259999.1 hypothetical protein [Pseudomonas koreensis]